MSALRSVRTTTTIQSNQPAPNQCARTTRALIDPAQEQQNEPNHTDHAFTGVGRRPSAADATELDEGTIDLSGLDEGGEQKRTQPRPDREKDPGDSNPKDPRGKRRRRQG
jgi:hypothetical protein